jgi:hypothetical protein
LLLVGLAFLILLGWAAWAALYHLSGGAAADACRDGLAQEYRDQGVFIGWFGPAAVQSHDTYDGCESDEHAETTVTLRAGWTPGRAEDVLARHRVRREVRLEAGISRWRVGQFWIFVIPGESASEPTKVRVDRAS